MTQILSLTIFPPSPCTQGGLGWGFWFGRAKNVRYARLAAGFFAGAAALADDWGAGALTGGFLAGGAGCGAGGGSAAGGELATS